MSKPNTITLEQLNRQLQFMHDEHYEGDFETDGFNRQVLMLASTLITNLSRQSRRANDNPIWWHLPIFKESLPEGWKDYGDMPERPEQGQRHE